MNNHFLVSSPYPACILRITHPLCADRLRKTYVGEIINKRKTKVPAQRHATHKVGDDYDDCERSAHLDFIGGFK